VNRILCIGEALIDMICTDKGKSLIEGENFLKKTGGAPTNVAAAIGSLGGKVDILAKVGNDPFGNLLVETMESFNVSTRYMIRDHEHFTTMAFVSLMENGERDFVFSRGADGHLTTQDIADIQISDYGICHFGSATAFLPGSLKSAYDDMLRASKRTNKFITFDPNYRHLLFKDRQQTFIDNCWRYMEVSDFYKVSDEEALLITSTENIDEAVKILMEKTEAPFAITIGAEGTLMRFKNVTKIIPSVPVTVVDTTGAGDAFVGAVLYQLSQYNDNEVKNLDQETWEKIIEKANIAGARTCQYLGAMEAFRQLNNSIM
jgi:fructokinase